MIRTSAPGKLFLSGEWAILEVGNPGIVAAVNKRVHCEIENIKGNFVSIWIDDFKIQDVRARFDGKELNFVFDVTAIKDKLQFIKEAIEVSLRFVSEEGKGSKAFKIRTWGEESQIEVDGQMKKVGFGSSAASVVAVVAGILAFNGYDIRTRESKDIIYKLSTIAHFYAQGKVGSAFDVAASTYGGVFVYKRFDPKWLEEQMKAAKPINDTARSGWPGFLVEELEIPPEFRLAVGWTKTSASTTNMVKAMESFRQGNKKEYDRIYGNIAGIVNNLILGWKRKDKKIILESLSKNEILLRELGKKSGLDIETADLKRLSEIAGRHGGAGKLSGAGGGDCGIAVCFDRKVEEKIKDDWKQNGIYLIDAVIDYAGVKLEK